MAQPVPAPRAQGFWPSPCHLQQTSGRVGFLQGPLKRAAKMNQTSGYASSLTCSHSEALELVPRCRTPTTSGCLGLAGCPPRRSQIAKERAITSSWCLRQLFFQKTQPTDCFPPPISSLWGTKGQDYCGAEECGGHPTCESHPRRNPDPLVSLETTYLLPLIPIPFPHLVGSRKKPAPRLCQLKRVF